jgi:hypothetical protein
MLYKQFERFTEWRRRLDVPELDRAFWKSPKMLLPV